MRTALDPKFISLTWRLESGPTIRTLAPCCLPQIAPYETEQIHGAVWFGHIVVATGRRTVQSHRGASVLPRPFDPRCAIRLRCQRYRVRPAVQAVLAARLRDRSPPTQSRRFHHQVIRARTFERELDRLLELEPTNADGRHLRDGSIVDARDKLLDFLTRRDVEPTNKASERSRRPSEIFRKVTNGFRSDWVRRSTLIYAPLSQPAASTAGAHSPRSAPLSQVGPSLPPRESRVVRGQQLPRSY